MLTLAILIYVSNHLLITCFLEYAQDFALTMNFYYDLQITLHDKQCSIIGTCHRLQGALRWGLDYIANILRGGVGGGS
jgi:hypothetical protein